MSTEPHGEQNLARLAAGIDAELAVGRPRAVGLVRLEMIATDSPVITDAALWRRPRGSAADRLAVRHIAMAGEGAALGGVTVPGRRDANS